MAGSGGPKRPGAVAPVRPDIPEDLKVTELTGLADDDELREVAVGDDELADQRAKGVSIATATFTRTDLSGSRLDRLRLTDVVFAGANLANLTALGASLLRVSATNCRLTGLQLSESELRNVMVRDCRIDLASFGSSKLERVTFEGCRMERTDFLEAQLDSVRFHHCDLTEVDFRGARMHRCEFRHSRLAEVQGIDRLRGSAMEWPDIVEMAGVWAAALGIAVLEDA